MNTAFMWAGGLGSVLALIGMLWQYVVRPITRLARFVGDLVDDIRGEPPRPGFEGRDGVLVRLSKIEATQAAQADQLARIEHELHPNGGSSLRDRVDLVADAVVPPR